MSLYKHFIGIDIGKFSFFVAIHGEKEVKEYKNTYEGINVFLEDYQGILAKGFSVLETTGGYETHLLLMLCEYQYAVHRADARNVKYFIRSYGNKAKTDKLDAKGLALYGHERYEQLKCYEPPSKNALLLLATIEQQVQAITQELTRIVAEDEALEAKKKALKSVPGIGEVTALGLLALMPELGQLNRREVASLAGLAPRANDSGRHTGYRATGYGRRQIRPILYMSAMAARNSNSELKHFYNRLIAAGKKKMVALTALMRKIIVIANARVKEVELSRQLGTKSG